MYFFFMFIAYSLSRIVSAIPYIPDNPRDELAEIGTEDPNGLLNDADIFKSQSDSNSPPSSPGNTDLFSELTEYDPTLSLANSGFSTDDYINDDIFSGDSRDAASSGLDETRTSVEIAASESNNGPCDEQMLNLCCTDTLYQGMVDPNILLPRVSGCAEFGPSSKMGACVEPNAKRFCCVNLANIFIVFHIGMQCVKPDTIIA